MKGASLALLLSNLLNNPNLPTELYNNIMRGSADISNNLSAEKSLELDKHETSPEYIGDLLEYYAEENTEEKSAPLDLSKVCTEFF